LKYDRSICFLFSFLVLISRGDVLTFFIPASNYPKRVENPEQKFDNLLRHTQDVKQSCKEKGSSRQA
jgi:hypothetical protein